VLAREIASGTAPAVVRLLDMAAGERAEHIKRDMGDIARSAPVPSTAMYSPTDGIANSNTRIEEEAPYTAPRRTSSHVPVKN